MPKVSVIVPVYNAEEHIKDCIGSILKQSYTNFELLLINDGSTDNSLEICHELSLIDDRIRLINQINKGASAARNRGLYASTGEWVVVVVGDYRCIKKSVVLKSYCEIFVKNNVESP